MRATRSSFRSHVKASSVCLETGPLSSSPIVETAAAPFRAFSSSFESSTTSLRDGKRGPYPNRSLGHKVRLVNQYQIHHSAAPTRSKIGTMGDVPELIFT